MAMIYTSEGNELLRRVRAEFDELPGMRMTFEQVARLFTVDKRTCEQTLRLLLRSGYLLKQESVYRRAECCHV